MPATASLLLEEFRIPRCFGGWDHCGIDMACKVAKGCACYARDPSLWIGTRPHFRQTPTIDDITGTFEALWETVLRNDLRGEFLEFLETEYELFTWERAREVSP